MPGASENAMTHQTANQSIDRVDGPVLECPAGRWWLCALLGVALTAAGIFVLFDVVLASVVSAIFFASAMIVVGIFQVLHAFSARGWGSLAWSLVVGVLITLAGVLMLMNPLATSLGLTLGLAALFLASGVLRLVLAYRHWNDYGWLLLLSGLLGVAFGVVIMIGYPWSGLVIPGLLLGFDLIMHGSWWMALGFFVRRPRGASRTGDGLAVPS